MSATTHPYVADHQSGAGNCSCGAAEHHRRHPHYFRRRAPRLLSDPICVCGLPPEAEQHLAELAALTEWEKKGSDQ